MIRILDSVVLTPEHHRITLQLATALDRSRGGRRLGVVAISMLHPADPPKILTSLTHDLENLMDRPVLPTLDPIEERHTAIHEAGHAVAVVVLGVGLLDVSIGVHRDRRTGIEATGVFHWDAPAMQDILGQAEMVLPMIAMYIAGPVAEKRINPNTIDPNKSNDFDRAMEFARIGAGKVTRLDSGTVQVATKDGDKWELYSRGHDLARSVVDEHWSTIEALADLLQTRRSLTGQEATEFIRDRSTGHADR